MAEVKVFLTTQELSERAGYPGPNVLHLWRKRGKGPPYLRIESRILYRITDVEQWERLNTVMPARCEAV
ncbi:MAG TPA: DNA-binding protein [Acidocella sp.]|nr:DNA-binding protein [Acidocella sp.]HQU04211.1 DNA-binding protein [Acidocella sp.]